MRRGKTHRDFYINLNNRNKHSLYNGRTGKNMSNAKVAEYRDLLWYLCTGDFIRYGWVVPIYRLQKNLKYRKKFINEWKTRREKT